MKIYANARTTVETRALLVDETPHQGKARAKGARAVGLSPRAVDDRETQISAWAPCSIPDPCGVLHAEHHERVGRKLERDRLLDDRDVERRRTDEEIRPAVRAEAVSRFEACRQDRHGRRIAA